ncbi:response regulator [Oceanimonas marisflavi]|uniref:response regulator n=1 Tax=Oceanimonas marisflavi TaxID=2059724 RepID=UPI000D30D2D4|nr:response regulator [Oceanimonas marisflavi]
MKPTILLVDDEPHILRIMSLQLQRQGYQISTCGNGEEAFARLQENPPDVLITDIQMPRMTGEQLCRKIQAEIPDRHFLIVLLTSRTELEHRTWSKGFDNLWFYEKPLSLRQLTFELGGYFEAHRSEI